MGKQDAMRKLRFMTKGLLTIWSTCPTRGRKESGVNHRFCSKRASTWRDDKWEMEVTLNHKRKPSQTYLKFLDHVDEERRSVG